MTNFGGYKIFRPRLTKYYRECVPGVPGSVDVPAAERIDFRLAILPMSAWPDAAVSVRLLSDGRRFQWTPTSDATYTAFHRRRRRPCVSDDFETVYHET